MSAQRTSRVSTLLSHHLFPSTNHGGCFIIKCVVEHLVHVLLWLCWLCLKPFITMIDDVACSCEVPLESLEPLRVQLVLCNRKWACVVSAICDEWQRGTHMDGKAIQPTTSATNRLQPQHTHHWSCTPHHIPPSTHTPWCTHTVGCGG